MVALAKKTLPALAQMAQVGFALFAGSFLFAVFFFR